MTPPRPPVYPASRNRVMGRISDYLNTLGNWSTYRDVQELPQLPGLLKQITTSYFGTGTVSTGGKALAAIMALHALEQASAAMVTLGFRTLVKVEPEKWHRGIAIRPSSFAPRLAKAFNWLGGRVQTTTGCYFHENGRTWHYQVIVVRVWGKDRPLAHLRSLSLPHRAHFFDRDITPQAAIDIVSGRQFAAGQVGHLGSINEMEQASGLLARAKLAFIAANWLLIDPEERSAAAPSRTTWGPSTWTPPPPSRTTRGAAPTWTPPPPSHIGGAAPTWTPPSLSAEQIAQAAQVIQDTIMEARESGFSEEQTAQSIEHNLSSQMGFSREQILHLFNLTANNSPSPPEQQIASPSQSAATSPRANGAAGQPSPPPPPPPWPTARYNLHGNSYPLLIKRIVTNPITRQEKADAIYYDAAGRRWQDVTRDKDRIHLARQVAAGQLQVVADWHRYL